MLRTPTLTFFGIIACVSLLAPEIVEAGTIHHKSESRTASASNCVNDASFGTRTWTNPQNASSSDNIKATVSVDGTVSNYIKCTSFGFAIPQSAIIKEIRVSVERVSDSTGNGGSNDAAIRIVKGGTIGTVDFSSGTIYTTSDVDEEHASTSVPLWGQAWTPADVNASNFGAAVAVTKPSAAGQAHNVSIDQIKVTVYYSLLPMIASQQGSIFENDDSASNVDGRSAQAAASTSIASVAQGERVNARFHLRMASSSATTTLGLFWDKNDGVWTKVTTNVVSTTTAHYCSDTDWGCHYVDTSGDVGEYASVAIDPSGNPWVSYFDSTNTSLRVARYVGSGGTGCADSAWTCMTIDNTDTNGYFSSLAFDKDGNAWISYEDLINSGLRVARYVGSGGTGCSDAAWTCTLVDSTNSVGRYTSIAADPFGNPWVSYYDTTNGDLRVARYVGTGGTGCADAAWTCVAVESTNDVGKFSSIVLDTSGNAWVSYYDITNSDLRVARYVGSGGSGCASSAWTCVAVYTTNDVGQYTSIAIDPSGNPWVAHTDASMSIIRTARYVGTGGSNCASGEWTCSTAGGAASAFYGRIAFDPSGNPWVSFVNPIGYTIGVARYVGSGGVSCSGSEWTCETIDTVNSAGGYYTSLAFDPNGIPWVAYSSYTSRDLRVARIMPRGIPFVPAASVAQGIASTTRVSHADMTSVSDTTNRNDADCVQTGGTWINGVSAGGEEITFAPWRTSGSGELCTEVNFALDTTHAATNTTYRLVVSMKDGWRPDVGVWRGLATTTRLTVHASTTIVSSGTAIRVLKGTSAGFGPCAHASWTCMTFNVAFQEGYYSDIEFDARGNPWTPYFNLTTGDLYVARYVGSSGTGCDASSWMCELIDTSSSDIGQQPSLAFDPSGNPWIAYPDSTNGDLKIARYVGSGGTGCSSSAWTCESIDTTNSVGNDPDVAFDLFGDPWIAYKDQTNTDLRIAHYVGVAGSGCVHTAWTCITVDATSSDVGNYPSLAFDAFGRPWVGYHDATNFDLRVARYVGAGGTGCAVSQWTCETADSSGDVGNSASLEFDRAGRAWIASQQNTGGDLRVTRYVGSGGSGCSSSAWTCSTIVTTNTIGAHISLAIDAQDRPWISFYDATPNDLRVARYVGSGGSGCDDSAWMCQTVDSTNTVGEYNSLAFDPYGVPWVAYRNGSSDEFRVAKLATSTTRYFATTSPMLPGSSAKPGRMLMLDAGKSPRIDTDGTCNAATDLQGYCGISLDDAVAEGVTADPSSRTLFAFEAFTTLSATPTLTWIGRSTTAPSTQSIFVEIYRAGTTNDWIPLPLTTNTCASAGTNTDCTIIGTPTAGTHAEYHYYDTRTWGYRTQFRITQIAPVYATTTLKTDHVVVTYPAALTQTHYRWRNDDGTETNASFAVNQDTILSSVPYTGDRIRLRLLLSNDGVAAATNKLYRLDFSSSSCSTYIPLGNYDDTASEWIADFSQWAPDGAASSNHSGLSDPEGKSFVAGEIRAGGRKTNTHALTSSQFTELEYTFRSTLAAIPSITYCFRVSDDGDDSEFSYPVIAQLILRGGARPQTGGGGAGGESQGSGSQQQGGGAGGGSGSGGEGSGTGGSQQGGGASGGGDSG